MEDETLTQVVQESVKIEKNSKGYNWESRIVFGKTDTEETFRARIIARDEFLKNQFGGAP